MMDIWTPQTKERMGWLITPSVYGGERLPLQAKGVILQRRGRLGSHLSERHTHARFAFAASEPWPHMQSLSSKLSLFIKADLCKVA